MVNLGDRPGTRERIVAEARSLFAEKGYDGATIAEIAKRAGVAEGTIYRHFDDKMALLMACVEPVVEEAFEEWLEDVVKERDLRSLVRKILEYHLRIYEKHRDMLNILFTESLHRPEVADVFLSKHVMEQVGKCIAALKDAIDLGRLPRPLDLVVLGLGIDGATWAILNLGEKYCKALKEHLGIECSTSNLLDSLTDLVMYGIAGESPAEKIGGRG